jgi:hypothetical protein
MNITFDKEILKNTSIFKYVNFIVNILDILFLYLKPLQ